MADLRALKDQAAALAARGKLDRAAEAYRRALALEPGDAAVRQRLAETLRRADRFPEAVVEYAAAAERFARDGLLVKSIALCKTILELDPAHASTQAVLAELYAARARADGHGRAVLPTATAAVPEADMAALTPPPRGERAPVDGARAVLPPGGRAPALSPAETPLAQILSAAQAARAAGVEEAVVLDLPGDLFDPSAPATRGAVADQPSAPRTGSASAADVAFPRAPLFSDLSREAFLAITDGMVLHRFAAGEEVLREGEAGSSFFVVAGGRLLVTKRDDRGEVVRLARLGEGDFFGEMALLSGAPRLASVVAEEDAEVLELRAEILLEVAGRHPHLATSLRRFYRRRLLANAMAVSPVFRPFSREDRREVMARFRTRLVSAGEVVIREGNPSDGLYVVLDGALTVSRRSGAQDTVVAELRGGDVLGEMSCLRKAPATATATVRRAGTLLRLPRADFDELVSSHPQILEAVAELSDERAGQLDAILSGRAQWTDEGLVLV